MAETGWSKRKVKYNLLYSDLNNGISSEYYSLYKLWELNEEEIKKFASEFDTRRLNTIYNDQKYKINLDDKELFNNLYKDYIGRKFWIKKNTNFDEFISFIDGLDIIITKPHNSSLGRGVEKIKVADYNKEELYEYLMSKDKYIVEEHIQQHHELNEVAPNSLNTIRVVVIYDQGECNIVYAAIRFSYKSVTDNFSASGMAFAIDDKTGELLTEAINKDGEDIESKKQRQSERIMFDYNQSLEKPSTSL